MTYALHTTPRTAPIVNMAKAMRVDLLTFEQFGHANGTHSWVASAVADDLPGEHGCIRKEAPTREAALFLLKTAIDEARNPVAEAA